MLRRQGVRQANPLASKKYGKTLVFVDYVNAKTITYYYPVRGKYVSITYGKAMPDSVIASLVQ